MFLATGEQLAGIISLSETGKRSGESPVHEAFVVPGTIIRRYLDALAEIRKIAEREKFLPPGCSPSLMLSAPWTYPPPRYPERLHQFVAAARAHGAERVQPSNEGADIDAVIGAARDKLSRLDAAGARGVLQAKIDEEADTRVPACCRC